MLKVAIFIEGAADRRDRVKAFTFKSAGFPSLFCPETKMPGAWPGMMDCDKFVSPARSGKDESRRRLRDSQVTIVIDRKSGLAGLGDHRRMPVDLTRLGAANDGNQQCVRIIGDIAETAIDADRYITHIAFVEIERAFLIAFEPEHLPAAMDGKKHFLGRMPVQRCALAFRRADIGDREAVGAGLYMRSQLGVLGDAHADHVDDFTLIGGKALVEESEIRAFGACARDIAALHFLARYAGYRFAGKPGIDNCH